jgi:vacuolar-type H+-ATPase subunit E/Vma4
MTEGDVGKILSHLAQIGEEEGARIVSEAEEKAQAIREEERKKAELEYETIASRGLQETRREKQRIIAEARIKGKKDRMAVQERLMQEAFDRAFSRLADVALHGGRSSRSYDDIMLSYITEGTAILGLDDVEIVVNDKDRERFAPLVKEMAEKISKQLDRLIRLTMAKESLAAIGGVKIRGRDGRTEVDNTFESRLDRFRDSLRIEAARTLFGEVT